MLKKSKIISTLVIAIVIMMVLPVTTLAKAKSYPDVKKSNVHYSPIMELTNKGIVKAKSGGKFYPSKNVSRGELAEIITKAKKLPIPKDINKALKPYKDVKKTSPYAKQIAAVSQAGILKAQSKGKFNASGAITRKEMAAVLVKTFALDKIKTKKPAKSHADKNIQTLINLKITTAKDMAKPSQKVTRGQTATFISKSMKAKPVTPKPVTKPKPTVKPTKPSKPVVNDPVESVDKPAIDKSKVPTVTISADARKYIGNVYVAVNRERKAEGLAPLKRNPEMENIAMVRAKDMATHNVLSHNTPTYGDIQKLSDHWQKWTTDDDAPAMLGENAMWSTGNSGMDVDIWMHSPDHKRNIMQNLYNESGVGIYTHKGKTIAVQIFQYNRFAVYKR